MAGAEVVGKLCRINILQWQTAVNAPIDNKELFGALANRSTENARCHCNWPIGRSSDSGTTQLARSSLPRIPWPLYFPSGGAVARLQA